MKGTGTERDRYRRQTRHEVFHIRLAYTPWTPRATGARHRETQSKTTPCSTFPIISWVPQRRWLKASSKIALRIGNLIRQIQVAKLHWRQWDLYKGRFCNGKSNTGTEKSCTLNKEVFQVNLNTSHRFVLKQFPPCPANKNWTWTTSAKSVTLCVQSHKHNSLQSYSIIDNWDINIKWYF